MIINIVFDENSFLIFKVEFPEFTTIQAIYMYAESKDLLNSDSADILKSWMTASMSQRKKFFQLAFQFEEDFQEDIKDCVYT